MKDFHVEVAELLQHTLTFSHQSLILTLTPPSSVQKKHGIEMTTICSRLLGIGVAQGSRFLRKNLTFCSNPIPNPRNFRTHFVFSPSSASSSSSSTILCRMDTAARASTVSNGGDAVVRFPLPPSSALVIQKGDITKWSIDGSSDAIVNPANERMLGGGGADGAIHRAAGPDLLQACYNVPEVRPGIRCPTGEARITPGFRLPTSHVIHTVGPIYNSDSNPAASLASAYRNSLRVAKENSIEYIAFPAISCGIYGYPYDEAASVAISTIREFQNHFKEVHFVLFSPDIYDVWLNKATELLKD